jgi:cytochrome P450 family 78 subfamily A
MVLTMTTGQEDFLLLLLLPTTSPLPPLLAALVLVAVLLWLSPGGPAWALSRSRRPPSGPPGVVTALSSPVAHSTLAALSRAVDGGAALMSFSVGLTRLVVSSQPGTAREILVSPAFGDRPVKDAARHLLFHRALGFAPSGDAHWRGLRRLAARTCSARAAWRGPRTTAPRSERPWPPTSPLSRPATARCP